MAYFSGAQLTSIQDKALEIIDGLGGSFPALWNWSASLGSKTCLVLLHCGIAAAW
jgi:hypothetical protein